MDHTSFTHAHTIQQSILLLKLLIKTPFQTNQVMQNNSQYNRRNSKHRIKKNWISNQHSLLIQTLRLKLAFGFLFAEIKKGYDFLGHGDIDVVYGNIRDFMTEEVLNNQDVISSWHDYNTGTFCLFRNNKLMNGQSL